MQTYSILSSKSGSLDLNVFMNGDNNSVRLLSNYRNLFQIWEFSTRHSKLVLLFHNSLVKAFLGTYEFVFSNIELNIIRSYFVKYLIYEN